MSQLELINMGEVARQEVDWLYYPYLPFGKISIVQGDPGEGKTLLMMAIIMKSKSPVYFFDNSTRVSHIILDIMLV